MSDVKFRVVSKEIVLTSGSGDGDTEDITISGFGTPKAVMLFTTFAPTQGTARNDLIFSAGFADATRECCVALSVEDGLATTAVRRAQRGNASVLRVDRSVTGQWQYEFLASMITDGVRLTLSENASFISGETIRVTAVLIGGADVTAYAANRNDLNSSVTAISAPGFEPDVVFSVGVGAGTTAGAESFGQMNIGIAAKDGSGGIDQNCWLLEHSNGDSTTEVHTILKTGVLAGQKSAGAGTFWDATLTSFDTNGFTVTASSNPGTDDLNYLALKLDGVEFKTFITELSNASSYVESSLGFTPDFGFITAAPGIPAVDTSYNANTGGVLVTAFDSTTVSTQTGFIEDAVTTSNAGGFEDNDLRLLEDDGTDAVVSTGAPTFTSSGWSFPITNSAGAVRQAIGFAVGPISSGVDVTVDQATETDTAQSMTPALGSLSVEAGLATETDTAQSITPSLGAVTVEIGQATETNSAFGITAAALALTVSMGLAAETDTAQDVAPSLGSTTVEIGQAAETDTAQSIAPSLGALSVAVDQATETDTAQSMTVVADAINVAVDQATETDTAQDITPSLGALTVTVDQATETDTAQAIDADVAVGSFVDEVLALTPWLYWKIDEASGALSDSSGNSNDSTAQSITTYQDTNIISATGAAEFNGSSDYAKDTAASGYVVDGVMSAALAFRYNDTLPASGTIFHVGNFGASTNRGFRIYFTGGNTVLQGWASSNFRTVTLSWQPTIGADSFVVFVLTTTSLKAYVDGTEVASTAHGWTFNNNTTTPPVTLGSAQSSGESDFMQADIGHFALFNQALTPTEITRLADAAAAVAPIAVGQASETDTAQDITPVITTIGTVGLTSEADSALSIDAVFDQSFEIGQAFELGQARIISTLIAASQTVEFGLATETDSAFDIDVTTGDLPRVYFEYEEHLDPIKKRGKAVLSRQLAVGETISIERKTPITQELSFSGIMDPQQLEYAFDKICFIEQEIEGSLCDCRGPVWPFGPPDVEPEESQDDGRTECLPYSCEAFGDILTEVYGGDVTSMNTSFATATTADDTGETKPLIDGVAAGSGFELELSQGTTPDASTAFRVQAVPLGNIDPCEEGQYDNALRIITSTVAGQGNLILKGPVSENYDVALVARSGREAPNNSLTSGATDAACIGKTVDVTFDYFGGAFSSSLAMNQTLYVEDDVNAKTATFKVQVNGLRVGNSNPGGSVLETIGTINLDPDVPAWYNWSIIQFQVKNFSTAVVADWVIGTRERVEVTRTIAVNVAYIGDDGEPQVLSVSREFKSYSGAFTGGISNVQVENITSVPVWGFTSSVLVAGLYAKETPVDLEDLFLAYRRNLTTYTPPDDCTFIGDVI